MSRASQRPARARACVRRLRGAGCARRRRQAGQRTARRPCLRAAGQQGAACARARLHASGPSQACFHTASAGTWSSEQQLSPPPPHRRPRQTRRAAQPAAPGAETSLLARLAAPPAGGSHGAHRRDHHSLAGGELASRGACRTARVRSQASGDQGGAFDLKTPGSAALPVSVTVLLQRVRVQRESCGRTSAACMGAFAAKGGLGECLSIAPSRTCTSPPA